jgi:hypothetical protein
MTRAAKTVLSRTPGRLEVHNHVARRDHPGLAVRRRAESRVAVERWRVGRMVPSDFRARLDLRQQPMLSLNAPFFVGCGAPHPLTDDVVENLAAQVKVVQGISLPLNLSEVDDDVARGDDLCLTVGRDS